MPIRSGAFSSQMGFPVSGNGASALYREGIVPAPGGTIGPVESKTVLAKKAGNQNFRPGLLTASAKNPTAGAGFSVPSRIFDPHIVSTKRGKVGAISPDVL